MFARVLPEVVMEFDKTLSHVLCEGLVYTCISIAGIRGYNVCQSVQMFCAGVCKCGIARSLAILKTKLPPLPPPPSPPPTPAAKETVRVECIATYSKGFICSGGSGTLHLFEKTDDRYVYKKTRSMSIWVDPAAQPTAAAPVQSDEVATPTQDILCLTLSPSEENVVCSTSTQQLYNLTLSAADLQAKVGHVLLKTKCFHSMHTYTTHETISR